jgi:hypothetical protein
MEQHEEIEMQIWEYLDGTCPVADMQRISILIERDNIWKEKYIELSALHEGLSKSLELEQPSLRFTQNVMDAVVKAHVAPATKQYINKGIIRGIAAVFIVMLTTIFGYALAHLKSSPGAANSRLNFTMPDLSSIFNSATFNVIIAVNVVIALVLLDALLRRKRAQQSDSI